MMNESSFFSFVLRNRAVTGFAMAAAMKNFSWPMLIIGIPAIYFGFKSIWYMQTGLFFLIAIFLFVPYFLCCLLISKAFFSAADKRDKFCSASDKEKGKLIGDALSGWW